MTDLSMSINCVPECAGCLHMAGQLPNSVCRWYLAPKAKWGKLGGCEGATTRVVEKKPEPKKRVGQQKQKKGGN